MQQTNLMAILALIFTFVGFPVGLVLGIIALIQIQRTGEQGKWLAIAAIIISCMFGLLFVLAFFLPFIMFILAFVAELVT